MHDSINKFAHRSALSLALVLATFVGAAIFSGCHRSVSAAQQADNSGPDPADANMAPVDGSQPDASQQQPQEQLQPSTGGAPVYRVAPPSAQNDSEQPTDQYAPPDDQQNPDAAYNPNDDAQIDAGQAALDDEQASEPPPPLPTYDQPEAPGPNYLWTPGYWGYTPAGYYWVPGVWCAAPYYGALWTPGYWGFYNGFYRFHRGYWGPYIGFYGGIDYGFGYTGIGYYGGYWNGSHFYYNTSVNRINARRINYVYSRPVRITSHTRVSYNGGRGGLAARPRPAELAAMRQTRTPPMSTQIQNQRSAASNRQQFFSQNRGRPAVTAAARPIAADRGIQRPAIRPATQVRPNGPQTRPNQPQVRPGAPQTRPAQPQVRPEAPQTRPTQPQVRPNQQYRQPQPQVRPEAPQTRPTQPQVRPNQQYRQQRPETQSRPQQQQRSAQQARPQQQQRPAQQARPQQQPRQQARPAPKPHEEPKQDDRR